MNGFFSKRISLHRHAAQSSTAGFTLIETMVAIFILSMSIGALLTLAAGGFYTVRYARNQIVAGNLAQESLEYIRNSRDSAVQIAQPWSQWVSNELTANGCFNGNGCKVDPYTNDDPHIEACSSVCSTINFFPSDDGAYLLYAYLGDYFGPTVQYAPTTYVRTVTAANGNTSNEVVVTVKVDWLNGLKPQSITQSMLLTNWQPQPVTP